MTNQVDNHSKTSQTPLFLLIFLYAPQSWNTDATSVSIFDISDLLCVVAVASRNGLPALLLLLVAILLSMLLFPMVLVRP